MIDNKWVFRIKLNERGEEDKLKSRFVPKGFQMREGIDYTEVFAPTLKYTTLRIFLSLVANMDYELVQLDVSNAFLNATVKEDVYTRLPEGFRDEDDTFVLKLLKALYGIHQAPREWYLLVRVFIVKEMGFTQCGTDSCLFKKRSKTGRLMLMVMFVDDFGIGFHCEDKEEWKELKDKFTARFKSTDKGEAKHLLGMRITRDRSKRTIVLDQEAYIVKMIEKFNMENAAIVSTPQVPGQNLSNTDDKFQPDENKPVHPTLYMQMIGLLLYAAITTRIDIAHAVHQLTMHTQNPLTKHWLAGKWLLRYLKGTSDIGLRFGGRTSNEVMDQNSQMNVVGYCDADYANDKNDRKSITGWIVKLNDDVVSWSSKKQSTVALSTCEAELYAEASCIQEVMWLQNLVKELELNVVMPSTVKSDNQSTIEISQNNVIREKTKHVDVKYKFVNEKIDENIIKVKYINTTNQQADILTKSLGRQLFEKHREKLMTQ